VAGTKGKKKPKKKTPAAEPTRFAHPFYTTTPIARRQPHSRTGTSRMLDHTAKMLGPVPKPRTATSEMDLAHVVGTPGAAEIIANGELVFHALGDSGRKADSPQGAVSDAMAKDYDIQNPGKSPAFLFHLGDVIYGPNKEANYRREFYEPYKHYPGKIIAIPGNHDGEVNDGADPVSLRAFRKHFCDPTPNVSAAAGTVFRETMNQPGVYWVLRSPMCDIIGLYSNLAENPGFISGQIPGQHQKAWLIATLQRIRAERAAGNRRGLVLATHHPPFTSAGHSPSTDMMADIDGACATAGLLPDVFLSGHAHSYQRYTRFQNEGGAAVEVPYIVVGTGGVGEQAVPPAKGDRIGDHRYDASAKAYGFIRVKATTQKVSAQFVVVDGADAKPGDSVTVDLATRRVS